MDFRSETASIPGEDRRRAGKTVVPPDGEGQEVGQGGEGDGAARPGHGQTEALLQRPSAVGGAEVVETLHGDEHVVDADAKEEEGDDVVEGAVREAAKAAEAVSKAN